MSRDDMKFEGDGMVHFEVTKWQRRRTIWYASLAEFCYLRSISSTSIVPGLWRRLGDMFTRKVFFFSQGGIPVPRDRKHTNAFREHVGLKPLETNTDQLGTLTADWIDRSKPDLEEPRAQDSPDFDRFAESMSRKQKY
jgi:hypothetical protein